MPRNNRAAKTRRPGRGNKRKIGPEDDALIEAETVLKKKSATGPEMRHALSRLTHEHKLLRQWCDKVQCDYAITCKSSRCIY